MPTLDLITGLSHGQREALRLLGEDLSKRRDLSDGAKRDLIADRLAQYRERNDERMDRRIAARAKPPIVVLAPSTHPRYFLGACLRCDVEMWVHSPKPRVPICKRCTVRPAKKRSEP